MTQPVGTEFEQRIREIAPPSEEWSNLSRAHLDTLTKPVGSLGQLEDLASQVAAIRQGRIRDSVRKNRLCLRCRSRSD